MLDHVGFTVTDFPRSKAFYDAVLPAIGAGLQMAVTAEMTGDGSEHAGYGFAGHPTFWIGTGGTPLAGRLHAAFAAGSRAEVDAFHAAALKAGATDNGPPGLRPHYHASYYAAFVLDPDGHDIEAVCHKPE